MLRKALVDEEQTEMLRKSQKIVPRWFTQLCLSFYSFKMSEQVIR